MDQAALPIILVLAIIIVVQFGSTCGNSRRILSV